MFILNAAPLTKSHQKFRLELESLEERCVLTGDIVLAWNHMALDAMVNDSYLGSNARQAGPDRGSRALAIVHTAIYDAVNSIANTNYPYLIQVKAKPGASIDAAAAQAAHDTLSFLFPEYQPQLDAQLSLDLGEITSDPARIEGIKVGQTVAAAILAARAHDGADHMMNYTVHDQPGYWSPDPLHPNQMAVGPQWGDVSTWAIRNANQFQIPSPPKMTSKQYTDAYNEVIAFGGDGVNTPTLRTEEQTTIGIFWGYDGSRGLSTPPRLYNQIAATLAEQQGNTVVENARFFALINIAMADAGISCWDDKYQYEFWRPVTAIRAGDLDGNPNTQGIPDWTPLGAPNDNGGGTNFTPPFPAYASGHATFGAATFRTMAQFFGKDKISFTIGSDEYNGITTDQHGNVRPVVTRSFTSFSQAAEENGQSRIYLGIHWKFDKDQGIRQGNSIADFVFKNYLRARHPNRVDPVFVDHLRATMTTGGTVILSTMNHRPISSYLTSQPRTATLTTSATSIQDSSTLVTDLITRLDKGVWGGGLRRGKTLTVDLTKSTGVEFSIQPCSFMR